MGLFNGYASVSSKYQMKAEMEVGEEVILQECSLVTSNGKSSTVHFRGIYIILPIKGISFQQLRTKGKPRLKGVKFDRVEEYPEERFFVVEGHTSRDLHPFLMQVYEELPKVFDMRDYFVASNEQEVHVALWMKDTPKMPQDMTQEELEKIVDPLHKVMQYAITILEQYQELHE
jgi:hypothetical protein